MSSDLFESGLLEHFRRNVGVRLSVWYALVFTVSSVALLTIAYYLLAGAIGAKDRELLEARLKEVAAVYQAGGVRGLQRWYDNQPAQAQRSLYVQFINNFNLVQFVRFPEDWLTLRDVPTQWEGVHRQVPVLRIPQSEQRDFILLTGMLPGGGVLR